MSSFSPKSEPLIRTEFSHATNRCDHRRSWSARIKGLLCQRALILCIMLFGYSIAAYAQLGLPSPSPTPIDLPPVVKKIYNFYEKITPSHGVRFVAGSIAPGSGVGGGVGYNSKDVGPRWKVGFSGSGRVSYKKYWEIDTNVRLIDSTPNGNKDIRGNLKLNFYAVVKDMPRLDFFGIGPNSREQDRAVFHYREAAAGFDVSRPVTTILDIGGAVEGIFPRIIRISNPTVRSVERVYNEATAPGITSQPNFLHLVGYAEFHSPGEPDHRGLSYKFWFHFFRDGRDHKYSFRRFDADLSNKFVFGADRKNEFRVRGRVSLSDTSPGNRVPFYLMRTLGGSDIRSSETLRGFRDYRFRDRNFALLQLEYMRNLKGPINFIAFYDTGKVASAISRFDVGRLRHTYGLGFAFVQRPLEDVQFRFYLAFGGGEGSRTYVGPVDPLGGRGDRLVR